MKKLLSTCVLSAALVSPFAVAGENNFEVEHKAPASDAATGFFGGALLGAAVGGPAGAILGGFGGILAMESEHSSEQLKLTEAELEQMNAGMAFMEKEIERLNESTEQIQLASIAKEEAFKAYSKEVNDKALVAISEGFSFAIQFRSGSYNIEKHYDSQLRGLAVALKSLEGLTVELTGYTDPRGNDIKNLELSKKRVDIVKGILVKAGVEESRISVSSVGESAVIVDKEDTKGYQFERRVQVQFNFETATSKVAQAD